MGLHKRIFVRFAILLGIVVVHSAALLKGDANRSVRAPPVGSLEEIPYDLVGIAPCKTKALHKNIDLFIYGATGTIGQLVVEYLLQGHPETPSFMIAGRNKGKLNALIQGLATAYPMAAKIEVFSSATSDVRAMATAMASAKVVMNLAGPYETAGTENVILAAMMGCAHYVDVSQETAFKARIMEKFNFAAEGRGLAIVQSAGFASVVADLLAVSAAQDYMHQGGSGNPQAKGVSGQGHPPSAVLLVWSKLNSGGLTGGAYNSVMGATKTHGVIKDPYILAPFVPSSQQIDSTVDGIDDFGFEADLGYRVTSYPSARFDCPVVRHSLARAFPQSTIMVRESQTHDAVDEELAFMKDPRWADAPMPALYSGSGSAPPRWELNSGSFVCEAIALGNIIGTSEEGRARKATRVTITGVGDPWYTATAKFVIEVGIALGKNGPKQGPGYWTPTAALGHTALEQKFRSIDGGAFVKFVHEKNF